MNNHFEGLQQNIITIEMIGRWKLHYLDLVNQFDNLCKSGHINFHRESDIFYDQEDIEDIFKDLLEPTNKRQSIGGLEDMIRDLIDRYKYLDHKLQFTELNEDSKSKIIDLINSFTHMYSEVERILNQLNDRQY